MDIIFPVALNLTMRLLLALDAGSPRIVCWNNHLLSSKWALAIRSNNGYIMSMPITNVHHLPEPVVRALVSYESKQEEVTGKRVSTLIDSPQISQLRQRHPGEYTEDVSDMFYRALGSAMHEIFRGAASNSYVVEERLSHTVDNTLVTGQMDYQFVNADGSVDLKDYKMTSVYAVTGGGKPEWKKQLNTYAWLIRHAKGLTVTSASIIAVLRDWRQADVDRRAGYPPSPIHEVPIQLWPEEEQDAYVRERVRLHRIAELAAEFDDLPPCSDEERWAKPAVWAVYKGNNKRAKLFDLEFQAEEFASQSSDLKVVERPATYRRCDGNYCRVAQHCTQYKGE